MNLKIDTTDTDAYLILSVDGEIDLYSSPQLRKEVLASTEKQKKAIIVDMSKVGYMDSSGVATLIEGYKSGNARGSKFLLSGVQPMVREVFELTRLDSVFTIFEDLDQAQEYADKL